MINETRLRRAMALYVLRGVPLDQIARRYELPLRELEEASKAEGWDVNRLAHLTEMSLAIDKRSKVISMEPDPLKKHALVADLIVQQSHDLVLALSAVSASDVDTVKMLRGRAECLRTMSEAAERAVKLAREARGLVQGQASAAEADLEKGVEYQIVLAPARKAGEP